MCGALLAAVFLLFVANVAARHLLAAPILWADELAGILLAWCVLLAGAFVLRPRDHVAFDLATEAAPPVLRRALIRAGAAASGLALLAALPAVADYILFLWRERTSALEWRLDRVHAAFAVFVAGAGLRALLQAWRGP